MFLSLPPFSLSLSLVLSLCYSDSAASSSPPPLLTHAFTTTPTLLSSAALHISYLELDTRRCTRIWVVRHLCLRFQGNLRLIVLLHTYSQANWLQTHAMRCTRCDAFINNFLFSTLAVVVVLSRLASSSMKRELLLQSRGELIYSNSGPRVDTICHLFREVIWPHGHCPGYHWTWSTRSRPQAIDPVASKCITIAEICNLYFSLSRRIGLRFRETVRGTRRTIDKSGFRAD